SIQYLMEDVRSNGYYGGIRLMKAAIRKFAQYCAAHEIELLARNFSIRYRSSIPRRLGLAGSSALVTATLRCLLEFYEVDIPQPELPNLILSVETEELGISAGLQDRVIQVYGGLVFMDFDREFMAQHGHGRYEELDPALLPPLYIAYHEDLGEGSETFHNNIRERWLQGAPQVVQAMQEFARYAQEVHDLLVSGCGGEIGPWLDRNFDLRRSLYQLDPRHIAMIERARAAGASAKFAGSGGAIVGTYENEAMFERLSSSLAQAGITVIRPRIES
ncbi:MAG: GHMP kinase, partial [Candidatus Hydrogenedentes bacterium]|nr:GHMP kinase [Candidatus Hydrogenedentota bacterium]